MHESLYMYLIWLRFDGKTSDSQSWKVVNIKQTLQGKQY